MKSRPATSQCGCPARAHDDVQLGGQGEHAETAAREESAACFEELGLGGKSSDQFSAATLVNVLLHVRGALTCPRICPLPLVAWRTPWVASTSRSVYILWAQPSLGERPRRRQEAEQ